MSKYTHVLILAAVAAVFKGVFSEISKLEAAARSRNWDEFNRLLSQQVEQSRVSMPMMPIMPPLPQMSLMPPMPPIPPMPPMPNITFPPFPKIILFKDSDNKNQSDNVTKFSGIVIRASNATIIDEKGNVIEKGGTAVSINNKVEILEPQFGDDPAANGMYPTIEMPIMPPMPTVPPMPTMAPMPNFTFPPFSPFPPFPKMPSFKEFEDNFGKIPDSNGTTDAPNNATSIRTTCYSLYFALVITLFNHLNRNYK